MLFFGFHMPIQSLFSYLVFYRSLYLAGVLLSLAVVVDTHEEQVACVFSYLRRIFLPLDLVDGGVGGVVELQFNDERGLRDIAARNHHKIGIALARGIFAMDDVFIARPDVSHGQDAGEGILIVIREDARVLIVRHVDSPFHGLLIASNGGFEEGF